MARRRRRPAHARVGLRDALPARAVLQLHLLRSTPGRRRPVRAERPAHRRTACGQRTPATTALGTLDARSEVGLQLRHDRIRVGLFDTVARRARGTTRDDNVRETLAGVYGQTSAGTDAGLRSVVGAARRPLRYDVDSARHAGQLRHAPTTRWSRPSCSLIAGPWAADRVLLQRRPRLPQQRRARHHRAHRPEAARRSTGAAWCAASGYEVGARTEALPGLQSSLALWKLKIDSELVYVGDAGTTEASRASRRRGVEWNNRWIPVPWLLLDADLAWTHARFSTTRRQPHPGAVERVASVAVTLRDLGPVVGQPAVALPRPARADRGQQRARARRRCRPTCACAASSARNVELTLDVFNLFDREVNDIEYFYESQLAGEAAPVADRHVHPAEPRTRAPDAAGALLSGASADLAACVAGAMKPRLPVQGRRRRRWPRRRAARAPTTPGSRPLPGTTGGVALALGTGNQFPVQESGIDIEAPGAQRLPPRARQRADRAAAHGRCADRAARARARRTRPPLSCWAQTAPFDIELRRRQDRALLQGDPGPGGGARRLGRRCARAASSGRSATPSTRASSSPGAERRHAGDMAMDVLLEVAAAHAAARRPLAFRVLRDGQPLADFAVELRGDRVALGLWRKHRCRRPRARHRAAARALGAARHRPAPVASAMPDTWESRFVTLAFEIGRRRGASERQQLDSSNDALDQPDRRRSRRSPASRRAITDAPVERRCGAGEGQRQEHAPRSRAGPARRRG